jgi:hypothetical protein
VDPEPVPIEEKAFSPMMEMKDDRAGTAERDLIVEAAWRGDGLRIADTKMGLGMEVASNGEIVSGNKVAEAMAYTGKIFFLNTKPEASKDHMSADNQRASQRFAREAAVIIENCDSATYTYGRMYNYSAGGLYFESDIAFQPGTKVRIGLEKPDDFLGPDHLMASVKWCAEITAAVVLYDYGIGVEFDRLMNISEGNGKFKVIEGGGGQQKP